MLFSDGRSFTSLTEALGAQGTVTLLNEYFDIMVDAISEQGGMVDKFIGDAIMAGFGIPLAHDDDEDRAVRASISMISELWKWNKVRESKGLKPADMGIGLNTDSVVSGNIGSPKRMDYTLIGDGVNLAAQFFRLGRLNLYYMTPDGDETGYWNKNTNSWVHLGGKYADEIDAALKIAYKQSPPDFINLPVQGVEKLPVQGVEK